MDIELSTVLLTAEDSKSKALAELDMDIELSTVLLTAALDVEAVGTFEIIASLTAGPASLSSSEPDSTMRLRRPG